jgi:hypothetical protein
MNLTLSLSFIYIHVLFFFSFESIFLILWCKFSFSEKKDKIFDPFSTSRDYVVFRKEFSGLFVVFVHKLEFFYLLQVSLFIIEPEDFMEFKMILRTHLQGKKDSIFFLISKFREFGQQCMTQFTKIMNTLL